MIRHFARCRGDFPRREPGSSPPAGRELCELLKDGLVTQGLAANDIQESEYDCTFLCRVGERSYPVAVSFDSIEGEWWEVFIKPTLKWPARLLGQSEESDLRLLADSIDRILRADARISRVRWYSKAFAGANADYAESPAAPLDTKGRPPLWSGSPLDRYERIAGALMRAIPILFIVSMLLWLSERTRPLAARGIALVCALFAGGLGVGFLMACHERFRKLRGFAQVAAFAVSLLSGLGLIALALRALWLAFVRTR